jgi:hypothetical protein
MADLQGNMDEAWIETTVRVGPDDERELDVEAGHFAMDSHGRNGRWTYQQARIDVGETRTVEARPERTRYRPVEVLGNSRVGPVSFGVLTTDASIDEWRFILDDKANADRPSTQAVADLDGDVSIRRQDVEARHWVRYLRDGVPVIASVPLGPSRHDDVDRAVLRTTYRDIPAMAFGEDDLDVAVMADMLVSGNSGAEMQYVKTFDHPDVLQLFERRPLHFMTYALAQNGEPYGAGIPTLIVPSVHDQWLSDMLIVQAHRRLHWYKYHEEHLQLAADLFVLATKVGVPFFSRSLQLLWNGLMILENMRPDLTEASTLVRRMSTRVYPEETFTTIRLDI